MTRQRLGHAGIITTLLVVTMIIATLSWPIRTAEPAVSVLGDGECFDEGIRYQVFDLGVPSTNCSTGTRWVFAYGINELGEVVGDVRCMITESQIGSIEPFVWLPEDAYGDPGMAALKLHILDGGCGGAREINDNGVIVGYEGYGVDACASEAGSANSEAVFWQLGESGDLEYIDDDTFIAHSVNNKVVFQIVGDMNYSSAVAGFVYAHADPPEFSRLTPLGSFDHATAHDINDDAPNAQVGGASGFCQQELLACSTCPAVQGDAVGWRIRTVSTISAAALEQPFENSSGDEIAGLARGVNNYDSSADDEAELVGWGGECDQPTTWRRALFWEDEDADPFDLGNAFFPSNNGTRANALNNNDPPIVIGQNLTTNQAVVWRDDVATPGEWCFNILDDLVNPDLGWLLRVANDINDDGWIVGTGDHDGDIRGFILIPFVDPSPGCEGDTDGDGVVDVQDLIEVVLDWNEFCPQCYGDVNFDAVVNVTDLTKVITQWGLCPRCVWLTAAHTPGRALCGGSGHG